MRTFSTKTVTAPVLDTVSCNCCGRSMLKDGFGYFEDYFSFSKTWGYHSSFDGETHEADICMDCYLKWMKTFVLPAQPSDGNDGNNEDADL